MKLSLLRYCALEQAAKEFIRKVEAGEARSTRSYNAFKLALALPKEQTTLKLCDEFLELVSMLSPDTKKAAISDLENARSLAVAELSEGDLSEGAAELLRKHRNLAYLALEAFNQEQDEINNLDKKDN